MIRASGSGRDGCLGIVYRRLKRTVWKKRKGLIGRTPLYGVKVSGPLVLKYALSEVKRRRRFGWLEPHKAPNPLDR